MMDFSAAIQASVRLMSLERLSPLARVDKIKYFKLPMARTRRDQEENLLKRSEPNEAAPTIHVALDTTSDLMSASQSGSSRG